MKKLLVIVILLLVLSGCSNKPVTEKYMTFQYYTRMNKYFVTTVFKDYHGNIIKYPMHVSLKDRLIKGQSYELEIHPNSFLRPNNEIVSISSSTPKPMKNNKNQVPNK